MVAPTKIWFENADRNSSKNPNGSQLNQVVSNPRERYNGIVPDGMRMLPAICGRRRCGAHDSVDASGYVQGPSKTRATDMPGSNIRQSNMHHLTTPTA